MVGAHCRTAHPGSLPEIGKRKSRKLTPEQKANNKLTRRPRTLLKDFTFYTRRYLDSKMKNISVLEDISQYDKLEVEAVVTDVDLVAKA